MFRAAFCTDRKSGLVEAGNDNTQILLDTIGQSTRLFVSMEEIKMIFIDLVRGKLRPVQSLRLSSNVVVECALHVFVLCCLGLTSLIAKLGSCEISMLSNTEIL